MNLTYRYIVAEANRIAPPDQYRTKFYITADGCLALNRTARYSKGRYRPINEVFKFCEVADIVSYEIIDGPRRTQEMMIKLKDDDNGFGYVTLTEEGFEY